MKEKIKAVLKQEYEIAKYNTMLTINITKIQIKNFIEKIKPGKPMKNRKNKIQRKLPSIRIVGNVTEEEVEEIHDSFVEFITDKYFKNYNCHIFKFKGDTYIRIDEPKKPGYLDMCELYEFVNKKTDKTFVDCLSRDNYSRYVNK